jgi:hypothetical protein
MMAESHVNVTEKMASTGKWVKNRGLLIRLTKHTDFVMAKDINVFMRWSHLDQ